MAGNEQVGASYYGATGRDFENDNGYSWDLVIVMEWPTPEGKVAPEEILKKLGKAGLETYSYYSVQGDEVYIKIRADLERLVEAETPIVYCPRASAYFGAEQHFGPHRYRDMLAAGLTEEQSAAIR